MSAQSQPLGSIQLAPELLVAIVSAVMRGVETWNSIRDRRRAAREASKTFDESLISNEVILEGQHLANLVPEPILMEMIKDVNDCWQRYLEIYQSKRDYLPQELDDASEAVMKCICRVLRRMYSLNRRIPPGRLTRYWDEYCAV